MFLKLLDSVQSNLAVYCLFRHFLAHSNHLLSAVSHRLSCTCKSLHYRLALYVKVHLCNAVKDSSCRTKELKPLTLSCPNTFANDQHAFMLLQAYCKMARRIIDTHLFHIMVAELGEKICQSQNLVKCGVLCIFGPTPAVAEPVEPC